MSERRPQPGHGLFVTGIRHCHTTAFIVSSFCTQSVLMIANCPSRLQALFDSSSAAGCGNEPEKFHVYLGYTT
jgi:hypothetical protein